MGNGEKRKRGQGFNPFVDSYETIRQALLQLFIYGCYDRVQGASRQDISERKYSDDIRRISCFWPDHLTSDSRNRKKRHYFRLGSGNDRGNYLCRSYQLHTVLPQDLNLYCFILQLLAQSEAEGHEDGLSVQEIIRGVEDHVYPDSDADIYDPMVRDKLTEMEEAGFVERRAGEAVRFRLTEDFLSSFTEEELVRLYEALFLYRDAMPLSSLGYQMQYSVGLYLRLAKEAELPKAPFGVEDYFLQSALNDEVVYKIASAIEEGCALSFTVPCRGEAVASFSAARIIEDRQYGRQYVYGTLADGTPWIRRLDQIADMQVEDTPTSAAGKQDILQYVWNASLPNVPQEKLQSAEIDFRVALPQEAHLLRRLEAEKRMGTVERLSDSHAVFRVRLIDRGELIPWVRSFGHVAVVRRSDAHSLWESISAEWAKALKNYGTKTAKVPLPEASFPDTPSLPATERRQPELFTEFRNAYYGAVTEAYYAMSLDGREFRAEELTDFLRKRAFPQEDGEPAPDSMAQALPCFGDNIKAWSVFREDEETEKLVPGFLDGDGTLPILPTRNEKRWLRTVLEGETSEALLGKTLYKKLRDLLHDVRPFPWKRIWRENGSRTDGDEAKDAALTSKICQLWNAIAQGRVVTYCNHANAGNVIYGVCMPVRIYYSMYLRKFQLSALTESKAQPGKFVLHRMNVANLTEIKVVAPEDETCRSLRAAALAERPPRKMKLRILPLQSRNDVERCFLLFSANPKEGWYDEETNIYHLTVEFFSFERRAIRRKLLSLGRAVIVDEPEDLRREMIDEIRKCTAAYREK